jgi:hypothetical protein
MPKFFDAMLYQKIVQDKPFAKDEFVPIFTMLVTVECL